MGYLKEIATITGYIVLGDAATVFLLSVLARLSGRRLLISFPERERRHVVKRKEGGNG